MQNVLTDEELAALQASAAESFAQVLRGLMMQLMSGSGELPIRYSEVIARD